MEGDSQWDSTPKQFLRKKKDRGVPGMLCLDTFGERDVIHEMGNSCSGGIGLIGAPRRIKSHINPTQTTQARTFPNTRIRVHAAPADVKGDRLAATGVSSLILLLHIPDFFIIIIY